MLVIGIFFGYIGLGVLMGFRLHAKRLSRQLAELDQMDISQTEKSRRADFIVYNCGSWYGGFIFLWPALLPLYILVRVLKPLFSWLGSVIGGVFYPSDAVSQRYLREMS